MVQIHKEENIKRSWQPSATQIGLGLAGLGAVGYLGKNAYNTYQSGKKIYNVAKTATNVATNASNAVNIAQQIYANAQTAAATKQAFEAAKMFEQGAKYVPSIPGGFPAKLSIITKGIDNISNASTPFYSAVSGSTPFYSAVSGMF